MKDDSVFRQEIITEHNHTKISVSLSNFDFDKNKVEKVLFNLISNAIKFTKANGIVTVDITKNTQTEQLQIQVIDTSSFISTMFSINHVFSILVPQ